MYTQNVVSTKCKAVISVTILLSLATSCLSDASLRIPLSGLLVKAPGTSCIFRTNLIQIRGGSTSNNVTACNITGLHGGGGNETLSFFVSGNTFPSSIVTSTTTTTKAQVLPAASSSNKPDVAATTTSATASFPTSLVEASTSIKNLPDDFPRVTGGPLKVLFLSSDTGGGHRASAESLAKQFQRLYPGTTYDLLDIWTADGVFPYKTLVKAYKHLSRHPRQWKFLYHLSNFPLYEICMDLHSSYTCEKKIRKRIESYDPDVVVSVHPAMNYTPLKSVRRTSKKKRIPFFTVVTDYGSAHSTWFQPQVDKIFVASERIRKLAKRRGRIADSKIVMAGLPIRQDFDVQATALGGDRTSPQGKVYRGKVRHQLGIDPNSKAILLMGGGEGVGSLSDIVNALYKTLTFKGIDASLLVVCGRNDKLRKELRTRHWDAILAQPIHKKKKLGLLLKLLKPIIPSRRLKQRLNEYIGYKSNTTAVAQQRGKVKVIDMGFVNNMAEFMVAADVIVTKAGPGTIAESAAVGLPVMLSSFLPGQEAGNVDIVLDGDFGAFCKDPTRIAETVASWLEDDNLLDKLSRNAMKEGHPHAAADIVHEIGEATQACIELNRKSA